jgi:hypothetical protein
MDGTSFSIFTGWIGSTGDCKETCLVLVAVARLEVVAGGLEPIGSESIASALMFSSGVAGSSFSILTGWIGSTGDCKAACLVLVVVDARLEVLVGGLEAIGTDVHCGVKSIASALMLDSGPAGLSFSILQYCIGSSRDCFFSATGG